jgi:energy-coupling factor transport system ATP-binding protein
MLEIHNLSYTYPQQSSPALKNINLSIDDNKFVIIGGANGSGKSTLLKSLLGKSSIHADAHIEGSILYNGKPINDYNILEWAGKIGIILQDPDSQITNLSVEEEVLFGLENLCLSVKEIESRADQMMSFFNLKNIKNLSTLSLSGGQKQRLSIASILAMKPEIIILDEPIVHLDPSGIELIIKSLNQIKDYVKLIIVSTHFLDPFLKLADRIIILENGTIKLDFRATDIFQNFHSFPNYGIEPPQLCELYELLEKRGIKVKENNLDIPIVSNLCFKRPIINRSQNKTKNFLAKISNIHYKYENGSYPLKGITANIYRGKKIAVIGNNGCGKTTLSKILAKLRQPTNGLIESNDHKTAIAIQNPSLGFIGKTVKEELEYGRKLDTSDVIEVIQNFNLQHLINRSPFSLSEGEKRRLSLATAILQHPDLLILDEPTAGIDSFHTKIILKNIIEQHNTVFCITHDPRILEISDEVWIIDDGKIKFQDHYSFVPSIFLKTLHYPIVCKTAEFSINYLSTGIPLSVNQLGLMI